MKNIMWFTLGVVISFYAAIANASDTTAQMACYQATFDSSVYGTSTSVTVHTFVGVFTDAAAAQDAVTLTGRTLTGSKTIAGTCTTGPYEVLVKSYYVVGSTKLEAVWAAIDATWDPAADSDGDGIPDEFDLYPDDNTPMLQRRIGFWTEDGDISGTEVATLWEAQDGTKFITGDIPENEHQFQVINPYWETPLGSGDFGQITDADFQGPTAPQTNIDPTAPSTTTTTVDPGMKTGDNTTAVGDSESSKTTAINTGRIADNTARLGGYAADLKAAVDKMRASITVIAEDGSNSRKFLKTIAEKNTTVDVQVNLPATEPDPDPDPEPEPEPEENPFDTIDPAAQYDPAVWNGDLTEGVDYQPVEPLDTQTWVDDFLNSNPFVAAMKSSGFNTSGSTCTATINLGPLGTHTMSICEFATGFDKAGILLLSLTTLGGFITVMRD